MGNSGSAHNINWDSSAGGAFAPNRSKSELNGYYHRSRLQQANTQDHENQTQTLLRRHHNQNSQKVDRTSMPPLISTSEQFKVLPKIGGERMKLRPTSNGILLHSGGTISGRNKDELPRAPGQMQRSRTLIFEQREEKIRNNVDERNAMPAFQRSQTLLHLSYKERDHMEDEAKERKFMQHVNTSKGENNHHHMNDSQAMRHARSEPDFRNDLNKPTNARQNSNGMMDSTNVPASTTSLTKAAKLNKYNKKRKAPAAPVNTPPLKAENVGEKTPATRRYRSNIQIKPQQPPQVMLPNKPKTTTTTTATMTATPAYRREKSCDAILLRSKAEHAEKNAEKRRSYNGNTNENRSLAPPPPPQTKPAPPPMSKQVSKIPQLKRTFYFGMQSNMTATKESPQTVKNLQKEIQMSKDINEQTKANHQPRISTDNPKETKDNIVLAKPAIVIATDTNMEEFSALNYRLHNDNDLINRKLVNTGIGGDEDSEINDNGLHVHIHPSLPRRQLDIPSFSPAAAWRMLTSNEEERQRQLQRSLSNTLNCESPIQLRNNKISNEDENDLHQDSQAKNDHKPLRREQVHTMAWTPQQDLEDDEDDDVNNAVDNETTSSDEFDGDKDEEDGLLFFNGRSKKGRTEIPTNKPNETSTSVGVHLFSLSLPRDSHLDSQKKNSMATNNNNNEKITGFSSLQKLKLTISGGSKCTCKTSGNKFSTSNLESSTEPELCEIHSCQSMFRSDNWVLHKIGTKDGATNVFTSGNGKLLKDDPTPVVEPISLSYLTGGKHIMYLPGITSAPGKDTETNENVTVLRREVTPTREVTKSAPRQRQRKKDTRESLQDETPVLRHQQSQQPTNSTQRFSFQSTVRILEKRRLAEKLSRDAEIREAQRKSELEAMKRVEEDFQRKRASEKANIRHQLRLYCSGSGIDANLNPNTNSNEQYNSLPALGANRQQQQQQHDSNNNKISCRRADPDGAAASPSPPFVADAETRRFRHEISHLPLKRLDSDCGDSDGDGDGQNMDITHFNRTASMVEPYLQSFMK